MKAFFDIARAEFGPLTQQQVLGLTCLYKASAQMPVRHRAYVLATAWHETGPEDSPKHMTPRDEIWGPTPAQMRYEPPHRKARELGNTMKGDGYRFRGRSWPQLTGRRNYQKASTLTGVDLVANPDLLSKDPELGAAVMVSGMTNGWFTGRKLSDCTSYRDMRRVVNGTDRADTIARYAVKFQMALESVEPVPAPDVPATPEPPPRKPRGLLTALIEFILKLFGRR